jgi:hypothetical protein
VFAYVVLRGELPTGAKAESFTKVLRDHVAEQLGAIARPDDIRFANNLPKTRSGKIMRRLLRSIARNEDITQDLSTLENPAIIDQLRGDQPVAAQPAGVEKPKARTTPEPKRKARPKSKAKPKRKAKPKSKAKSKPKAKAKPRPVKKKAAAKPARKVATKNSKSRARARK